MCNSGYRMTAFNECIEEESDIDLDTINDIPIEENVRILSLFYMIFNLFTLLL